MQDFYNAKRWRVTAIMGYSRVRPGAKAEVVDSLDTLAAVWQLLITALFDTLAVRADLWCSKCTFLKVSVRHLMIYFQMESLSRLEGIQLSNQVLMQRVSAAEIAGVRPVYVSRPFSVAVID